MTLQSLVLSRELCEALSKKVSVPSVLFWVNWNGAVGWKVEKFAADNPELGVRSVPAYTLGEMPAVFKALGEVMGWKRMICTDCRTELTEKNGYPEQNCSCFEHYQEQETWLFHWLEFCRLYAISKEDAEQYLFSLLK